jgi:hypothetical protein
MQRQSIVEVQSSNEEAGHHGPIFIGGITMMLVLVVGLVVLTRSSKIYNYLGDRKLDLQPGEKIEFRTRCG